MSKTMFGALAALAVAWPARAADLPAATVNGEVVSLREVESALAQTPPALTPLTAAQKRQQRLETVSVLVDEKLIRQFLAKQGPPVEPAEVLKQFAALEAAQNAQGKTVAAYLKEAGLTEERIKDNFRLMLQLAKYIDGQVTEEKLTAYFAENKDFFEDTTVRTSHIVVRVGTKATAEDRRQARAKLAELRADIAAKKTTFAEAAKVNSQCPTAPKGGDIGFINRKWQVEEVYAKTAFGLDVGQVSDVVETEFGCHLITVTERMPGRAVKYAEVAKEVRDCYETEVRQQLLARLRQSAKVEITLP